MSPTQKIIRIGKFTVPLWVLIVAALTTVAVGATWLFLALPSSLHATTQGLVMVPKTDWECVDAVNLSIGSCVTNAEGGVDLVLTNLQPGAALTIQRSFANGGTDVVYQENIDDTTDVSFDMLLPKVYPADPLDIRMAKWTVSFPALVPGMVIDIPEFLPGFDITAP